MNAKKFLLRDEQNFLRRRLIYLQKRPIYHCLYFFLILVPLFYRLKKKKSFHFSFALSIDKNLTVFGGFQFIRREFKFDVLRRISGRRN